MNIRIEFLAAALAAIALAPLPACAADRAPAKVMPAQAPDAYFPGLDRPPFPSSEGVSEPEPGKPIVWIVIDALRPQHLGAYGYRRPTSPTLDKLADEGVIFTRFFANAPWTRPATASMMTGLIPARHRTQCDWHRLPKDAITVAQVLKKAGYTTLAVVGNGNAASAFGFGRGFDDFADTAGNWTGLPNAGQVYRRALRMLRAYKHKKKIFLFVFAVDVHDPYRPKPPYDTMFLPGYKGKVVDAPHWEHNNDYPEPVRRKMIALYDGLIRYTDDQLAGLFTGLREHGLYDEASIFVTSDHGESFGEHGVYLHGHHLYETHLRIPLMIRAPWIKAAGRYSPAFLQQIDLFPTFADLAGTRAPRGLKGISIVDALRDPSSVPRPRHVISEYNCYGIHRHSIRTRTRKLVYQRPADEKLFMKHVKKKKLLPSVSFDKETFLMFDMTRDPHETRDIWPAAKDREGAALLKLLKRAIDVKAGPDVLKELDPELVEELRSLGYMQ